MLSLEFPYVMALPPYVVPSHLDVEHDVGPIADFIERTTPSSWRTTGSPRWGDPSPRPTTAPTPDLGSAPQHPRRALGRDPGTEPHYLAQDVVDWMYRYAESVIYPSRDATRRPEGGDRHA